MGKFTLSFSARARARKRRLHIILRQPCWRRCDGIRVSPFGQRLLAEPAQEVDHVLLSHIFHVGLGAIFDELVNASAIGEDGLGVQTTCFKVREIPLGCRRERGFPADSCGCRALHRSCSAEPPQLIIIKLRIPPTLRLQCVSTHGNPILLVIKVVRALGMFLFIAVDDAAVWLDFSVRIEGSFAGTPRDVCELDALV